MPLYEFRCLVCQALLTEFRSIANRDDAMVCESCASPCERVISGGAIHLSAASKVARADPKYDRLVDKQMRNTPAADPDHYLKRMRPFSDASDKS